MSITVFSSCVKCRNTVIVKLKAGETSGAKYICGECADSDNTIIHYPEIIGFNRKELPAGKETYVPYQSAEQNALDELKLHCVIGD